MAECDRSVSAHSRKAEPEPFMELVRSGGGLLLLAERPHRWGPPNSKTNLSQNKILSPNLF